MKLHEPVKGFVPKLYPQGDVTQWFGENKELYSARVCSGGVCLQGHNGIDIVRPHGTPILSVCDGKVVEVRDKVDGYGMHVRILGEGYEWVYGHLSKIECVPGQEVKRGEQIGLMGNTGFVVSGATPFWQFNPFAGTHLHLGRRPFKVWDGTGTHNMSYPTGDKGNIVGYPGDFLGSVPITAEDFETVESPVEPQKSLTVQSLLNVALDLEKQGKASQAAIVRAVAGVVQAFGY